MNKHGYGVWGMPVILSAIFLLLFSLASFTSDQVIIAFGPEQFVRQTGAPQFITRTFALPSQAANPCTLTVQNGDSVATRVTSATLTLNGAVVAGPADFKKTVARIEKAVVLQPQNTLTIQLAGKPGSFIIVSIHCPQAANTAPVANAGPDQTAPVGATLHLDGSGSSDADGNPLSYAWSFLSQPAGSAATLTGANTVNPSFVLDRAGAYVVQLIVNDGQADSTADTVTISTENSPPVANAGPDQTARVGATLHLDGSDSSDADGNPLSYAWSFLSQPAGSAATLSGADTVNPTFVLDRAGTYVVQLIVHDGTVNSAPDTVTITTENSPPVANAGPAQTAFVGSTVTLDGSGSSDVDGDPLTFQWSLLAVPTGSNAVLTGANTVHPGFVIDLPGSYVAQLIVHDGTVNSAPATVTISTLNSP